MFEIGLLLFGAKRWFLNAVKALLGSRYFWAVAGLIAALWLAQHWHASAVAQAAKNATQAEYDRMVALHELSKAAAIDAEQRRAKSIIDANKERYETQLTDIQNRSARLLAEHRSGAVRLRVPVKSCPVVGGDEGGTEPNTAGMATTTRAELSDDANQFFIGQAQRADNEAIEHNRLVTLIEEIRAGKAHSTTLDDIQIEKP